MTKRKQEMQSRYIDKKKNNIIKYKGEYYNIIAIEHENSCLEKITIENSLENYNAYKKSSRITIKLCSDDEEIKYLPLSAIIKLQVIIKYITAYNSTIQFINKRREGGYDILTSGDIEFIMQLNDKEWCGLPMNKLYKIQFYLKKTHDSKYQIKNLKINPYLFITEEDSLITFKNAENIKKKFNLDLDFKIKLEAFVYHTIRVNNNSIYMKKIEFDSKCQAYCLENFNDYEKYSKHISSIIKIVKYQEKYRLKSGILKNGHKYDVITTNYLYNKENNINNTTFELFCTQSDDESDDGDSEYENSEGVRDNSFPLEIYIDNIIKKFEAQHNLNLEKDQKYAIKDNFLNPCKLKIITGAPGTGKTAIVKCILRINYELYKIHAYAHAIHPEHISLMAPTGLAFSHIKNDQESKHYNSEISGTCHRTVYHTYQKIISENFNDSVDNYNIDDKEYCEDKSIKFKLILIDEASMLDLHMFHKILKICKKEHSKLILIGDVDQLPAVGPGNIFKTMINSQYFDVNELTKIKRQDGGALVNVIYKMKKGDNILKTDFDNKTLIYQELPASDTLDTFLPNLIERYKLHKNTYKVLCYNNKIKYLFNTTEINNQLQDICNTSNGDDNILPPNNISYSNNIFRLNDKIIRTENDYSNDKMRVNGDQAIITYYDGEKIMIDYNNEDKPEEITRERLYQEFTLNYSTTIHKAQGSQYDDIVFFIEPNVKFIKRDAFYTAISRAKKRCIIITTTKDLSNSQTSTKSDISFFLDLKHSNFKLS